MQPQTLPSPQSSTAEPPAHRQSGELLVENQRLLAEHIAELQQRIGQLESVLDSVLAARESDYIYALAARRIRDGRLPRSRAEAALLWQYGQWRKHGDDELAYEPLPSAAIEAANARSQPTPPETAPRNSSSRAWRDRKGHLRVSEIGGTR